MNEEALFDLAIQKPAEERAAFLDEACAGDPTLRQRLEVLLRAHENPASFLNKPPVDSAITTDQDEHGATASSVAGPQSLGTHIGPYKLLKKLGEGGMGTVYLAEQEQPVKRQVALKIIKPGMDSAQVIARFEAERQALAVMDHPNIAKVLEAGTVGSEPEALARDSGTLAHASGSVRPYFVMELVQGIPITKYCDQEHLTPKERLELFIPVCQAVQHAHQKGIIHRDLKPSNVMVGLYDGKPIPKVIDFGVAKATQQKLTERTMFTEVGQIVGTLEYMAPEQAELTNLDIDTRADIYSLGVILYELLTGSPPFTSKQLRGAAFTEMLRMIREVEPSKPSTKLSSSDELPSIAANRKLDPKKLTRQVHGELDWIVMKCLEKERGRRYDSANGLAMDVQRYLADEPVLAGPPSARYRLRKFVSRNKRALAVGACLLLAAAVTAASAVWQLRAQAAQAVERAERQTETERVVSAALVEAETFNAEGWKQIDDPDRWQATAGLARSAVKRAEGLLATGVSTAELAERVQALRASVDEAARASALRAALDRIRLEQAAFKEGRFQNRSVSSLYAAAFQTYGIQLDTASAEWLRASPLRDILLAGLENWQRFNPDEEERQRLGQLLRAAEPAADALRTQWRTARGNGPALAALARQAEAAQLPEVALVNMANDLRDAGELAAAERLLRAGQERSPHDFWLNHDLGLLLLETWRGQDASGGDDRSPNLRQPNEAVRFLTAALALRSRNVAVYSNLGSALKTTGDLEGAIRHYRQALDLEPKYTKAHYNLGNTLFEKKDLTGAIRYYRQAVDLDPRFAAGHHNLGFALYLNKDLEGAIRHYLQALDLDPKLPRAHVNLGIALYDKGDLAEAIRRYHEALDLNPKSAKAHGNLGVALYKKKDLEGAIRHYRQALDLEPKDARSHHNLGVALSAKGDLGGAISHYQQALKLDPKLAGAHLGLGNSLKRKGDVEGAIRHYRQALELDPKYVVAYLNLANVLHEKKEWDGAIAWCRKAIAAVPKDARLRNQLGWGLYNQRDIDGAVSAYRAAITLDPQLVLPHVNLGNALCDRGDYSGGATAYRKAAELSPGNASYWYHLAGAQLAAGQRDAHRQVCTDLMKRLGKTKDPAVAARVVYTCLTTADAVADPALLLALAELAATQKGNARLLGAALYRAGKYAAALEPLKQGQNKAWDHLFLAMAHHHLGQTEKARDYLQRAVDQIQKSGYPWRERIEAETLRREAEALIKGTGQDPPTSKK